MKEDVSRKSLGQKGAKALDCLRECNVHRTRHDLYSPAVLARASSENAFIDILQRTDILPKYIEVRRDSLAAFVSGSQCARDGKATNQKPFSQRFIKGLILAEAAGASLATGRLIDAIGEPLAELYGNALPFMQDAEIWVGGGENELPPPENISKLAGLSPTSTSGQVWL